MTKILLKTTIPTTEDDWHIERFSMLKAHLAEAGHTVTAKDREPDAQGDDVDLAKLATGAWDQLWLFAVDVTGALTKTDVSNIKLFRANGGGTLLTRDHQDMGTCLTKLGLVGAAHNFHSVNPEMDESRRCRDDPDTTEISWPNYHSGANGDAQHITVAEPLHPIMMRHGIHNEAIQFLPSHPHEGAVSVPQGAEHIARVIATGKSKVTGVPFNLAIAFEAYEEDGDRLGRALAASTFHHFCDYNLDTDSGAPSFVSEPPGDGLKRNPQARADALAYYTNIARWLA
ncbi:MAG: hypothetical protein V2J55_17180 [Candidatus Competibacteraceae bacterium]|jgi:hypothetical protein|nr:hypothetical protein [Candidatus Competibacteraceae bacterium]